MPDAYSKGIKEGTANAAIEVADRFHLLVNLREAFQKVLYLHNSALKQAFTQYSRPDTGRVKNSTEPKQQVVWPKPDTPNSERLMKFEKAKELAQKGYSLKAMSKILNAHRRTIKKYLRSEELPRRQAALNPRYMTNFFQFKDYLFEYYKDQDYQTLYANIRVQGFNGKYTQFCHNMNRFIKPEKQELPRLAPIQTWSTSRIAFMVLQQQEKLTPKDQNFLDFLFQKAPKIKVAAELTRDFKNLFLDKKEGALQHWLGRAINPDSELQNFAKGIKKDYDAVNQAVISNISNGQVEGQVNRLKNIKRMMYRRAYFKLLRRMVLANSS